MRKSQNLKPELNSDEVGNRATKMGEGLTKERIASWCQEMNEKGCIPYLGGDDGEDGLTEINSEFNVAEAIALYSWRKVEKLVTTELSLAIRSRFLL
ncbi:hypothetical protein RYX36_002742 [Vicia faba]